VTDPVNSDNSKVSLLERVNITPIVKITIEYCKLTRPHGRLGQLLLTSVNDKSPKELDAMQNAANEFTVHRIMSLRQIITWHGVDYTPTAGVDDRSVTSTARVNLALWMIDKKMINCIYANI
jgi:hypothetical protein